MNWPIISTIISAAAALVGGMILWNLNKLNETIKSVGDRLSLQERETGILKDRLAVCRQECDTKSSLIVQEVEREKVSKEDWIRSEAYTRSKIDGFGTSLATISASMNFIERLPLLIASTVRSTVEAIKGGKPSESN